MTLHVSLYVSAVSLYNFTLIYLFYSIFYIYYIMIGSIHCIHSP